MIPALRSATNTTARTLEIVRVVLLLLILGAFVMYPVELFVIGHWLDTWESLVPFYITVPAVIFTVWIMFDRNTSWVRWAFIVTMWAAIVTGLVGAYWHWIWNMEDTRGIAWNWSYAMDQFHGFRPVLAAMAYTNMGVTGLVCIFRAR